MPARNLEILAYEDTVLGPLCLRRRRLLSRPGTIVTEVTLNHAFLMSSYNTESERALARIPLDWHSGARLNVLIGGLGLGYTAHAALSSPRVERAQVIEFLPQVIEWVEQDLTPISCELKEDERFTAIEGDIFRRLSEEPAELFDLVLIDVDHSPDEPLSKSNDSFYSKHGLERAGRHLAPEGILGIWSHAQNSDFSTALDQVFREVRVEPITYFNDLVDENTTDWIFLARGMHLSAESV
ncbi:MAG: spermidine synthase [Gemmatimonas sp.]|nr:spermidine synthase [Gemmatimonas sp.]